jgi:hypothetical protein
MPLDPQTAISGPRSRWPLVIVLVLVVLLIAGGVWLWHAGFIGELLDKDQLVAALCKEGAMGPLLCIAA